TDKPNVENELKADDDPDVIATTFRPQERLQSQRGDANAAFATAPVKLDQTYVTPAETHNPLELHATTAIWDSGLSTLTLYESSRAHAAARAGWRDAGRETRLPSARLRLSAIHARCPS